MKVNELTEEGFKPFNIEITIESEQDLCDLWHRINASARVFNDDNSNYLCKNDLKHLVSDNNGEFWGFLDKKVELLKLKK